MKNTNSKIDKNTLSNDNYKQTELGELPESWEVVRLGEVIIPDRIKIKAKDYSGNEKIVEKIPFNTGKIVLREKKETGTDLYKSGKNRLLISKINFHQGAVAITNETVVATTHYDFFKVLPNSDILFFWYYLRSSVFKDLFVNEIKFRGYKKEANYNFIKDFKIPLPPLLEQKKIAYVLSTVQEAQEKTEKYISALKEFKKSMMKHLFTYGAVNPKDINKVELKETEIGFVIKAWRIEKLDKFIEAAQYGISKRAGAKGRYPMLRMNNMQNGFISYSNLQFLDLEESLFKKFKLNKGDILFNRTNSIDLVGKTSLFDIDGDFVFGSYLIRIKTKKELLPEFLNHYMNWEATQFRIKSLASRAVGQANISASKIKTLVIVIPPLEEQLRIAKILTAIDERIEAAEKKKEALKELFNSLLKNLMTAKIRVNNIKEVI